MSVRHGILGVLARSPQHGYELKKRFEELSGGFWELNYGQIYSTLDRLERDGLVAVEVASGPGAPERRVYRITQAGEAELRRWLAEPAERPRPLRDELFVKLAFLDRGDVAAALRLIAEHKRLYLQRMAALTRRKTRLAAARREAAGPPAAGPAGGVDDRLIQELLMDAALFHAEADIRWLDHCEAKLRAAGFVAN